jgi:hypothetical protein
MYKAWEQIPQRTLIMTNIVLSREDWGAGPQHPRRGRPLGPCALILALVPDIRPQRLDALFSKNPIIHPSSDRQIELNSGTA